MRTNPQTPLTPKQRAIYNALAKGGKYSVTDLCFITHFSDPRGLIRDLRDKGVKILDEWRENATDNGRYKVYWIAQ